LLAPHHSKTQSRLAMQGPSPDEVALVEGGRQLGFEFLSRTMQGVTLRMLGHEATFDVLNMMEFSSERGRMSVIARSPDGTIRLYAKGADSKMLATLNKNTNQELLDQTARNLHLFATQVSIPCLAISHGLQECHSYDLLQSSSEFSCTPHLHLIWHS